MAAFIKKLIGENRSLTESQKKIVGEIMGDPEKFLMLGIEEFSLKVGVSKATISRFVKHLEYNSYNEFQQHLKKGVLKNNSSYDFLNSKGIKRSRNEKNYLFDEIENLAESYSITTEEKLDEISKLILKRKKIYLVGFGLTKPFIEFLSYKLKRLGIDIKILTSGGKEFLEEILYLQKKDLLILMGFNGSFPELKLAQEYAKKKDVESILFLENNFSELITNSDYTVLFKRTSVNTFKSLSYPMFLLNILVAKVDNLTDKKRNHLMNELIWLQDEYIKILKEY